MKLIIFPIAFIATLIVVGFISGCSSIVDDPIDDENLSELPSLGNDTLFINTSAPVITASDINSISDKAKELVRKQGGSTRASELEVYKLEDDMILKNGYAIENPDKANSWIIECTGRNSEEPLVIIFEQIDENIFVAIDENGDVMRKFFFDPTNKTLWTYNEEETRGRSKRDQILCGGAFEAAGWLLCEALAVPSGGASLLIGIGFTVAAAYVC